MVSQIAFILIFLALLSAYPLFYVADTYKPLEFQLMLLTQSGGRMCYYYHFKDVIDVDLNLLSGALEAVSSFTRETIRDDYATLNLVKHGAYYIIIEKIGSTSAALVVNKNSEEIHKRLVHFIKIFNTTYSQELAEWIGNLNTFKGADDLVGEIWGPLLPTTDFVYKE